MQLTEKSNCNTVNCWRMVFAQEPAEQSVVGPTCPIISKDNPGGLTSIFRYMLRQGYNLKGYQFIFLTFQYSLNCVAAMIYPPRAGSVLKTREADKS